MKKVVKSFVAMLACSVILATPITSVVASASSLDDIVDSRDSNQNQSSQGSSSNSNGKNDYEIGSEQPYTSADDYIKSTQGAADLRKADIKGANKISSTIRSWAAFIVRVLSYFITAFLVVRVMLDLTYVGLPFTRSFLANGYGGTAQGGQQNGMGMNSGMGGYGMGGYGMNRMGMNRMGMNGMQGQSQQGATAAMGRVQWVSNAALNAAESEKMNGPDGKPQSAVKLYTKDMTVVLIITPILLTLAITGVLQNLGFLIGDMLVRLINGVGGMM